MSDEPIRWLDDPTLSASLRADLAQSASATVHGLDTGAGLAALRGTIAAQTGALAPGAASSSFGAKALVGVLLVGGGLGLWKATTANDDRIAATEPVAMIEPAEPVVSEPVRAAIPEASRSVSAPVVEAPVVPEPPVVEAAPAVPSKPDDRDRRRDESSAASRDAETADARTEKYLQEATMVARARKSLASDPKLTLELTDQIADEFPRGQLVEERRALAIRALAKLGRLDEAKSRASDFLVDHARGPHAAAVRRAIGETP